MLTSYFVQAGESNDFKGMKVAFYGTYWISGLNQKREIETTTMALQKKGATVPGSYRCKGKFAGILNRGHPNKSDLDNAKKFARDMAAFS